VFLFFFIVGVCSRMIALKLEQVRRTLPETMIEFILEELYDLPRDGALLDGSPSDRGDRRAPTRSRSSSISGAHPAAASRSRAR
jgi:hypothetical protein